MKYISSQVPEKTYVAKFDYDIIRLIGIPERNGNLFFSAAVSLSPS